MTKISALLTHHKPELEHYLLRALESVAWQKEVDLDVHVIYSGDQPRLAATKYPQFNFYDKPDLNSPTKKCNYWLDNLLGDATHTMLLSNDVILSSRALVNMSQLKGEVIQSPLSNNEHGHRFSCSLPYPNNQYDYADVDPAVIQGSNFDTSMMIRVPWISFYSPFIPVSVWDKVGRLNPAFDKKYNDTDFCFRAAMAGVPTVINTSCYALHFGSKTTKNGYMLAHEEQEIDKAFFAEWPPHRILPLVI